jgi:hypothetical protein
MRKILILFGAVVSAQVVGGCMVGCCLDSPCGVGVSTGFLVWQLSLFLGVNIKKGYRKCSLIHRAEDTQSQIMYFSVNRARRRSHFRGRRPTYKTRHVENFQHSTNTAHNTNDYKTQTCRPPSSFRHKENYNRLHDNSTYL